MNNLTKIKILSLCSSLNKEGLSTNINNFLLEQIKNKNIEIEKVNLNDINIASNSLNSHNLKDFHSNNDSDLWIEKLKNIDYLILSFPMINFTFPASVKNFMDLISVANKTFSYKYSKKGDAIGLINNLKVVLISTQGAPEGWYQWGKPLELLEGIFKFLGAREIKKLLVAGTKVEPYKDYSNEKIIEENIYKIEELANFIKR